MKRSTRCESTTWRRRWTPSRRVWTRIRSADDMGSEALERPALDAMSWRFSCRFVGKAIGGIFGCGAVGDDIERKSVVEGKSVSGRVERGGRSIIQKKRNNRSVTNNSHTITKSKKRK